MSLAELAAAVKACFGNEQPLRCDVFNKADAWRGSLLSADLQRKEESVRNQEEQPQGLGGAGGPGHLQAAQQ